MAAETPQGLAVARGEGSSFLDDEHLGRGVPVQADWQPLYMDGRAGTPWHGVLCDAAFYYNKTHAHLCKCDCLLQFMLLRINIRHAFRHGGKALTTLFPVLRNR